MVLSLFRTSFHGFSESQPVVAYYAVTLGQAIPSGQLAGLSRRSAEHRCQVILDLPEEAHVLEETRD